MVTSSPLPAGAAQWADPIQRLCALLETITYRVLEVEERLTALEARLEQAPTGAALAQEQALAGQWEETERRLARMEEALGGLEVQSALELLRPDDSSGRRLQVLARPSGRRDEEEGLRLSLQPPLAQEASAWHTDPPGTDEPEAESLLCDEQDNEADPFFDDGEQAFMDDPLEPEDAEASGDGLLRRIA